jgi:preprotein translocase subunit YajC
MYTFGLLTAASSSGGGSSSLSFVILLVLLGGFFYMFMVRPQKRKVRQHEDLVSSLVAGDEVVTIGGIVGYVKLIQEDFISLEISDGCVIRVLRQAIGRKVEAPEPETAELEGTAGSDDTE